MLPRERGNVPDAVLRVPGPPVPHLPAPYSARAVRLRGDDVELVAEWMSRPHLARAWEYNWPVQKWREYLAALIAGTYALPLLVSREGVDFAYVEVYRAAKDRIAERYDCEPRDLGLHAAIADPAMVNRGLGSALLPIIAASVLAADPACRRLMFDPGHRNAGARRVCERAGCRFLGEHDMGNRRMALYTLERASSPS